MTVKEFMAIAESYAPLYLSDAFKQKGANDNSGVIVKSHDDINKVLFALDLSESAVDKAVKLGIDTIVTHHPAIYYPISSLSIDGENSALLNAIKNGLNVISMHLNLDIAETGVDFYLAEALGAKTIAVIDNIVDGYGYGRECTVDKIDFLDFVNGAVKSLKANNYFVFAKSQKQVKKFASFCGAGSGDAVKYTGNADTIITSDLPHHAIKKLVEDGKRVIQFTHYATEMYGFRKFAEYASQSVEVVIHDEPTYL